MTKSKTKRAFLASVLSMLLCCAMLAGSTFAWFTDSATNEGNIIKSGTLRVKFEWANGTNALETADWKDASKGAIFNSDLWEPGYTEVRHVKISNIGKLALKYEVHIDATGEVSDLAEVIDVYYIKNGKQIAERSDLESTEKIGTLADVLANPSIATGHISGMKDDVISSDIATIALKMREDADNEYQDLEIGSSFAIQLVATQYTEEEDSFDDQYDKEAVWPVASAEELKNALGEAEEGDMIVLAPNVVVDEPIQVPVSGLTIEGNGATVNVEEGESAIEIMNGIDDVTLHGLKIKGTDNAASPSDRAVGVMVRPGAGDVVIDSCTFEGTANQLGRSSLRFL